MLASLQAKIFAAIGIFIAGLIVGGTIMNWKYKAAASDAKTAVIEQAKADLVKQGILSQKEAEKATSMEELLSAIRTTKEQNDEESEASYKADDVWRKCIVPVDGVRSINSAVNSGAAASNPGKP